MKTSIGLMSGTSMDGIDAVILRTDGIDNIQQVAKTSLVYPEFFKLNLREEELKVRTAKKNIASKDIIKQSTEFHSQIIKDLLKISGFSSSEIDVIGYHGQSLYHNPEEGITIQIGDGQLLADLTGITCINQFRKNDILNGGKGAPLAPLYHHALAKRDGYFPCFVANCGGIANISVIEDENNFYGFDTGPGNVLLDRYIREKTNNQEFMDFNGQYSSKGKVNYVILEKLLSSIRPYLELPYPKSLDPGDLKLISEIYDLSIYDACATLAYFTAKTIVESVKIMNIKKWVLAGGGWNNPSILKYLKELLDNSQAQVNLASDIGWDNTYMEAEIFAYLAVRSFKNLPITFPNITGVKTATLGGDKHIPRHLNN